MIHMSILKIRQLHVITPNVSQGFPRYPKVDDHLYSFVLITILIFGDPPFSDQHSFTAKELREHRTAQATAWRGCEDAALLLQGGYEAPNNQPCWKSHAIDSIDDEFSYSKTAKPSDFG